MWTNKYLAAYLNISNNDSYVGKEYMLSDMPLNYNYGSDPAPNEVQFSSFMRGRHLCQGQLIYMPSLPGPLKAIGPPDYKMTCIETDISTLQCSFWLINFTLIEM